MENDKLISANRLKQAIKAEQHIQRDTDLSGRLIEYLIDKAPDEDVAPVVHGRWIHPKGYVVSNGFLCSVCGHEATSYHPINPRPGGACIADENGNFYYPPKMNFCPNCGAKMDLEGDDGQSD